MRSAQINTIGGALIALFLALPLAAQTPPQASRVLEQWLQHIDQQRYAEAWEEAGEPLRQAVSRDTWVARFQALNFDSGVARERRLVHQQRYQQLPDAPPGDYLVTVYASQFGTSLGERGEVVTLQQTDYGWQPIGYYRLDEVPEPPQAEAN